MRIAQLSSAVWRVSAFQLFPIGPVVSGPISPFRLPNFSFVEVGTPVARRPPHRSRRAVFPHRALQPDTLSSAHRKVCQFGSVVLTELLACVDFVRLSTPSAISGLAPCHDLL